MTFFWILLPLVCFAYTYTEKKNVKVWFKNKNNKKSVLYVIRFFLRIQTTFQEMQSVCVGIHSLFNVL